MIIWAFFYSSSIQIIIIIIIRLFLAIKYRLSEKIEKLQSLPYTTINIELNSKFVSFISFYIYLTFSLLH